MRGNSGYTHRTKNTAQIRELGFNALFLQHQVRHRELEHVAGGWRPSRRLIGRHCRSMDIVVHGDAHNKETKRCILLVHQQIDSCQK